MKWEIDIELPPEKGWDYLSQPEFRKTLIGTERMEVINKNNGRISSGSVYHCFHGKQVVPQTVVEWQPFNKVVTRDRLPLPIMEVFVYEEYRLAPNPPGTRFSVLMSRSQGPLPGRLLAERAIKGMEAQGSEDMRAFKRLVEADAKDVATAPGSQPWVSDEMIRQEAKKSLV